ncbi:MAG: tandem-95 repeat protein, partial [Bacilli bacterium]|nr:tandem-95 repeat protein [Bacilli bacterium]
SLKNNPMKGNVELDTSTGAYTYTALPGLAGDDAFSVKVSDGFNEIMIAIGIHIESQLQTETNIYRTTSQNVPVEGVIVASDKDGDALSYSLKSGAANGVAQISDSGSYRYTPDADFYGDDSFLITVTDGASPVDVTIHIHMNRKPIAVNDMISVVANGSSITASVSAEDADGDALTYSVYTQPSKGVAAIDSNNGKFSYTPNDGAAGDDWFIIKASDGTDYVLITVHVHNETELEINTTATMLTASQGKTLEGAVAAVDADGDTLSYRVAAGPDKGVLNLNSHTGSWSYACNSDAQGEDSFEIAVTDGVKEKNVTFHININIPPKVSVESKLSFVTNQGTPYIGTVLGVDGDGDSLTYIVISQGQKGSVIIDSSSGQYTYMPHEGAFGNDQFVLGIMDGVFLTQVIVSAHIETDIVVNESVQNVGVDKGGLVCGNVIASDADGDVLSYSISSEPTKGVAAVDPNGAWSFLADGADAGTDSFVIAVTDGTHTKYVTIHVHIDTTPAFEAESQTISVPGNRAVTDRVLATDLDGDQLTYSLAEAPKNGTVNLNSKTGSYTYTNTIKATSDTFKIKVVDTNGNEATIVIYVRINNAPTIQNLTLSVHQGESVEGQLNAADGEGDPLTYSISAQGKKGLASVDSGSGKVVYVAERGASGVDTFVVSVSDGANVIQTTVVVNIQANSAPFSPTLNLTTKQGAPVSGTIGATDADGDDLSFELSVAPLNGVVSVDPSTGSFVYTPYHNFSGTDSFNIRVFDGLDYGEATVNVSVEKNEAPKPKAERQNYSVAQGNSFSGTIEVDDMEGDDLSFAVAEKPRYGSVQIDQKTGTFNYQANPFASGGLDSFTVEVSDGFNVSRVMVQVSIDSTAMNIGFVAGGAVAYTGVVVAAVLIVIKLRKKGV